MDPHYHPRHCPIYSGNPLAARRFADAMIRLPTIYPPYDGHWITRINRVMTVAALA